MNARAPKEVVKEASMLKQKEMISGNYAKLASAKEQGRKVVSTFVPGNLNELIMCFDLVNNLPEINAIQNGMRKKTGGYIMEAEKRGHSEDVCTYVKADLGMIAKGNLGPDGQPLPAPDALLLSYTGCFTFMKWFELVREQYKCETLMLHVPYEGDGHATKNMRDYIVKQLKEVIIPGLERTAVSTTKVIARGATIWNMMWLSYPMLDKIPGAGSDWHLVYKSSPELFAAIVSDVNIYDDLHLMLHEHPAKFAAWFAKEDHSAWAICNVGGSGWPQM